MDRDEVRLDALWRSHAEAHVHTRHFEDQRSKVAGPIVAIAAALIGVSSYDGAPSEADLGILALVVALGIFGALFAYKQFERAEYCRNRAKFFRAEIDLYIMGEKTEKTTKMIKDEAEEHHNARHWVFSKFHTRHFWTLLYFCIAIIGILMIRDAMDRIHDNEPGATNHAPQSDLRSKAPDQPERP